jgi:competence protein ComEC
MGYSFIRNPIVSICCSFAAGIAASTGFDNSYNPVVLLVSILVISVMLLLYISRKVKHINREYLYSVILLLIFFFLGNVYSVLFSNQKQKIDIPPDKSISLIGNIADVKERESGYYSTIINVKHCKQFPESVGKKIVATIDPDKKHTVLAGKEIVINSVVKEINQPLNPSTFNYSSYLLNRGILYKTFVKSDKYIVTGESEWSINGLSTVMRNHLINRLRDLDISEATVAFFASITLGDKSLLDRETKEVFAKAGAMHLLAISGLHVGIVYLILSYLLMQIPSRSLRKNMSAIIISVIWFYAIVTGLSPSVQRSALMFSLIAVGKFITPKIQIYNNIFLSAFILLLINPDLIFDVGFQLSYTAVVSIVFFYNRIFKLIKTRNRVLKYLWGLIAVSIAAQIGTFPLSIYYFNQFPNLFILSNIFIVPMTVTNLGLSLVFIGVHPVPYISKVVSVCIDYLSQAIIYVTEKIASLPYAASENIYISSTTFITLMLFVIMFGTYLAHKKFRYLLLSCILLISALSISAYTEYTNINRKEAVVYASYPYTTIGFTSRNSHYLVTDMPDSVINKKKRYILDGYRTINQIKNIYRIDPKRGNDTIPVNFNRNIYTFGNRQFLIYDKNKKIFSGIIPSIKTDYILLSGSSFNNVAELIKSSTFDLLIIDSSVPNHTAQYIVKKCNEENKKVHWINRDGALIIDI